MFFTHKDKIRSLVPIHDIEVGAMQQLYALVDNQLVDKLIVMPDVHMGYDVPIGCAAITKGAIYPSWVGYDIGCGVVTCEYDKFNGGNHTKLWQNVYDDLSGSINSLVVSPRTKLFYAQWLKTIPKELANKIKDIILEQIGTIGSGNHFVEIGRNTVSNNIAITVHSGSRRTGWLIADHYMQIARQVGPFMWGSDLANEYIHLYNLARTYAELNRNALLKKVQRAVAYHFSKLNGTWSISANKYSFYQAEHNVLNVLDCCDAKKTLRIMHQKGVVKYYPDETFPIPGNMRDGVFLMLGLSNKNLFNVSAHGAGRVMSRGQAKNSIDPMELSSDMQKHNILCAATQGIVSRGILEEAPAAYKNIYDVLTYQDGINTRINAQFQPIINIKGA